MPSPAVLNTELLGGAAVIPPPIGFSGGAAVTISRRGNSYATNFDITSLIPAATTVWYVDPVSGNDGTGVVNDSAHPLQKLSTALAKSGVNQVRIINLAADYIALGTFGWNNVQVGQSCSVIVEGNFRFLSCRSASSVVSTWTKTAGRSNVYQATATVANAGMVVDFLYKTAPTDPKTGQAITSVPKSVQALLHVADIATVDATPGSFFCDGTNVYVQASDSRSLIGDTNIQACNAANNGRFPASTNNITVYVEGIDFIGGAAPFFAALSSSSVTGCILAFNHCSAQAGCYIAGNMQNGLSVVGKMAVYTYRSGAYLNAADGFNEHSFESDGTTLGTSPVSFHNESVAWGNGTTGSTNTSDNNFTCHDDCRMTLLNCRSIASDDRCMAFTNFARVWALGSYSSQSVKQTAGSETWAALISAQLWLDGCGAGSGANPNYVAAQSAVLKFRNMSGVTNAGTGEATGTVAPY